MDFQNKNLKETSCLLHGILHRYLNNDDQLEFSLDEGRNNQASYRHCKNVLEEAISKHSARMRRKFRAIIHNNEVGV